MSQVRCQLPAAIPVTFVKVGRLVRAGGERLGKFRLHGQPPGETEFYFIVFYQHFESFSETGVKVADSPTNPWAQQAPAFHSIAPNPGAACWSPMSFALPPIAPPAPAPVAGAAMPAGSAQGFDGLVAAQLGVTGEAQPQAQAQALPGGKLLAQSADGEGEGEVLVDPETDGLEEGLPSLETQLSAASLLLATTTQSAALPAASITPSADLATSQALQTGALPSLAPTLEPAAPDAPDLAPAPPSTGQTPNPAAQVSPLETKAQSPAVDLAQPVTSAPSTSGPKATVEAPPQTQAQPAAVPPSQAPGQTAAAQPLMASAVAAGMTSLRATQSNAVSSAAASVEQASDSEAEAAEPAAVAKAAAKPVFGGPPVSPFALTGGPSAPIVVKPDSAFVATVQTTSSEIQPAAVEVSSGAELDSPDLPAAGQIATSLTTSEIRDPSRLPATPATVADLAAQVSRKLEGRNTHFDIQLTPEGLGKVDVRVDIDAQGRLTAAMAFDNPQAAHELRGRSSELLRALEQAGFDMSGGLSFSSPQDQGSGGRFADQAPDREAWQGRAFQNAMGLADEADAALTAARTYQPRLSATGVDVRI